MSELQQHDAAMDDEEDADGIDQTPTPVPPSRALEARIEELQRQLADLGASAGAKVLPSGGPDDLIEWTAPEHPVEGIPYTINGKKIGPGRVTTKRRVADEIMAAHGRARRIESERLMSRGSEIPLAAMDKDDFISRLRARTRGTRHV